MYKKRWFRNEQKKIEKLERVKALISANREANVAGATQNWQIADDYATFVLIYFSLSLFSPLGCHIIMDFKSLVFTANHLISRVCTTLLIVFVSFRVRAERALSCRLAVHALIENLFCFNFPFCRRLDEQIYLFDSITWKALSVFFLVTLSCAPDNSRWQ